MKLTIVVLTPGKMEGKAIPITLPQFLIGRDPACHLRPASQMISKKHCAILLRGEQAFIRDIESTNGTFVNNDQIHGERELKDGDRLKLGPLEFRIVQETAATESAARPPKSDTSSTDDAAAALLLSIGDEPISTDSVDSDGIPTGSTVMETISPPAAKESAPAPEQASGAGERERAAKAQQGNTSAAAKAILEKYLRRPHR